MTAWLCGTDGRGKLILDALPDRYFIAEVSDEAALMDDDWASGEAVIAFTCQPFALRRQRGRRDGSDERQRGKSAALGVQGNAEPARVPCHCASAMNTATVETPTCRFNFTGLGMTAGETLVAAVCAGGYPAAGNRGRGRRHTLGDGDADDGQRRRPAAVAGQGTRVTVKTEKACSVELTARGRYL